MYNPPSIFVENLKKKVKLCTFMEYLGENVHQVKMLKVSVTFLDGLANCSCDLGSTEKIISTFALAWSNLRNRLGCK